MRFSVVRGGAGLVFRYASPADFWQLVPAPAFRTWVVQHVLGGRLAANEDLHVVGAEDGTVVQVELSGTEISVKVSDQEAIVLDDPAGAGRTVVGFAARGPPGARSSLGRLPRRACDHDHGRVSLVRLGGLIGRQVGRASSAVWHLHRVAVDARRAAPHEAGCPF